MVTKRAHFKQIIADAHNPDDDNISILRRKFALSKLAKAIWNSTAKCFITETLCAELDFLIQIIEDPAIQLSTHIAHLINRTPDYQT